jgi:hypothetical protein
LCFSAAKNREGVTQVRFFSSFQLVKFCGFRFCSKLSFLSIKCRSTKNSL